MASKGLVILVKISLIVAFPSGSVYFRGFGLNPEIRTKTGPDAAELAVLWVTADPRELPPFTF
jgi:hypothetical protein